MGTWRAIKPTAYCSEEGEQEAFKDLHATESKLKQKMVWKGNFPAVLMEGDWRSYSKLFNCEGRMESAILFLSLFLLCSETEGRWFCLQAFICFDLPRRLKFCVMIFPIQLHFFVVLMQRSLETETPFLCTSVLASKKNSRVALSVLGSCNKNLSKPFLARDACAFQ